MAGPKRPRNAAALELAAAQGDIGAARIRIEQIQKTAERLAEDCAQLLSQPPFARIRTVVGITHDDLLASYRDEPALAGK